MQSQPGSGLVGRALVLCLVALMMTGGLVLGACSVGDPEVTVGRKFPLERLAAVKRGMSTKKQVEDLLGKPYKVQKLEGRKEKWRYFSKEESVQRVLLVIPTKTFVTEHELFITFDGPFVEQVDKQSHSYTD